MDVFTDPDQPRGLPDGVLVDPPADAARPRRSRSCSASLLAAMRVSPVPVLRCVRRGLGQHLPQHAAHADHLLLLLRPLRRCSGVKLSDDIDLNNFWLGVIGLSVYTAAFVCEAIRSGINTVPAGQAEAARAIGLTFVQTLRHRSCCPRRAGR